MKKEKKLLCLGLSAFLLFPLPSNALQKKETIYENLNYKGENTKISVSNHLTFVDKKQIEDETKLKNILNIGGNETFISNGNQLTWNTNEKDIFYTGETTEQSPIRVNIRYFLNQEEKDLKEMIGSKGKIKIINNNGKNTYTFTKNGSFKFIYEDELGLTYETIASVNWINESTIDNNNSSYNNHKEENNKGENNSNSNKKDPNNNTKDEDKKTFDFQVNPVKTEKSQTNNNQNNNSNTELNKEETNTEKNDSNETENNKEKEVSSVKENNTSEENLVKEVNGTDKTLINILIIILIICGIMTVIFGIKNLKKRY